MERKVVEFQLSEQDKIEISHLSSESRTLVWLSRPFDLIVTDVIIIVQGTIRCDGYLSLKILKNGKMIYPCKKGRSYAHQPGVSIILKGIDPSNITETLPPSDIEAIKIMDYRAHFETRPEWVN